jgi:acyl-coenzyme A synthetase/AMP-(fatty) acid ligase
VEARIDANGILQVKSPSILTGYHNRPELYANSMTKDGYFVTGDLFRVNKHGFYFYIGRADDMFKSGGEKIYPSEIESVIDSHPAVAISTVVGVPDNIKGYKPYAFAQLKPNATATEQELKEFTIVKVATYQIPRQVWILEQLPKTNIGKIDRKYLINLAQERLNNDISTTK